MSIEAHHQFILNTMQRHDDIARKFIHELEVENARLKTDYARLKAEVERLETQINETVPVQISVSPHQMAEYMQKHRPVLHKQINDQEDEIKRLKAEVERLEGLVKYWQIEAETDHAHWVRHAETNERLRKAGDAMALCITEFRCGKYGNALDKVGGFYVWQDWLAAKEGKQS